MEVRLYRVPVSSFPRMSYAYNNSLDIIRDCNKFARSFNMKENEISIYENVFVNICKHKNDSNFPVEIRDVVSQEDKECLKETTKYYGSLDLFLKQQSTHSNALSVNIVDAKYHDEILETHQDDILIVYISETEISENSKDEYPFQIFSRRDLIKTYIGNLLERRVLQPIKKICECLWKVRTSIDALLPDGGETSSGSLSLEADRKVEGHLVKDIETLEDTVRYRKLMNEDDSSKKKESKSRKRKVQGGTWTESSAGKKLCTTQYQALSAISCLRKADRETVDNLLKSILALYQMTNIPESQQPQQLSEYQPKELDEKLCDDLFSLSGSIKGMGYNSNILVILLSEKADEKNETEEKIANLLHPQKLAYKIERVSEEMHLLMHVGAKLEPVPGYGTLGCFAIMGNTKNCILLSRHVAMSGQEMYFENKRKVCKILQATTKANPGDLDIAAAEIYKTEPVCSSQFKDSSGRKMKGILHEYKGADKLITESRKVHIWGASTKPGKGVIKIAEFIIGDKKCRQTLIQIVDKGGKFAEEGDSGAIVCADDPDGNFVHAFGMVIGMESRGDVGGSSRTYLALPLSDGLKQLEKKTGHPFKLW